MYILHGGTWWFFANVKICRVEIEFKVLDHRPGRSRRVHKNDQGSR